MLATLAAAAAPPLAPPGAADAPTLDLYVGEERRTTLAATHATATEALAAAVLRAGDPQHLAWVGFFAAMITLPRAVSAPGDERFDRFDWTPNRCVDHKMMGLSTFFCLMQAQYVKHLKSICLEESRAIGMRLRGLFAERLRFLSL